MDLSRVGEGRTYGSVMRLPRPSSVYVLGSAGINLGVGLYLSAYPVFIDDFLKKRFPESERPHKLLFTVLLCKTAFDFIFDIVSSYLADFVRRFSRRGVFVVGVFSQALAFVTLAILPIAGSRPQKIWTALIVGEALKTFGDMLISSTFESWAISLETHENPAFKIEAMFARAQLATRVMLVLASVMAVGVLIGQKLLLTDAARPELASVLWVYLWSAAAAIQMATGVVLWICSKPPAVYPASEGPAGNRRLPEMRDLPTFKELIRCVIAREAWPAILLIAALYTLGFLVIYTWPVLFARGDSVCEYFTPTGIFVFGAIGAMLATARTSGEKLIPAEQQTAIALRGATFAAGLILVATVMLLAIPTVPGGTMSLSVKWVAIALILLSRIPQFFATPFVMTLIHRAISREDIRAAVVSLRTAFMGLGPAAASVVLCWYGWDRAPGVTAAKVFLAIAATVLCALAVLWWKVAPRPRYVEETARGVASAPNSDAD